MNRRMIICLGVTMRVRVWAKFVSDIERERCLSGCVRSRSLMKYARMERFTRHKDIFTVCCRLDTRKSWRRLMERLVDKIDWKQTKLRTGSSDSSGSSPRCLFPGRFSGRARSTSHAARHATQLHKFRRDPAAYPEPGAEEEREIKPTILR